ncbi:Coatomer subunit gamma-2-like protein [Dinothrombium tinctorium]|uniref:Coatomer subunit gamma n=1 Tax=Dinothrombium tinctorium TaxID=1965070 RepID=A0A3S3PLA0_9ACAR|nr:Coatomer subunit gamma-2-like protein [Dinothrombium tinctorium]
MKMYQKREKKDDEDAAGSNPFSKLQKTAVLQEARVFNETPVNARKCALILTKILYLINQGETLSTQEATDAFFNMTKLFQSKDTTLRRLVYIGIKELSKLAENVYVVTSSLTTDMNAKEDQCRPSAIRTLTTITDVTTFQGIERYMKQAIVDKNAAVASAALVSSLHMAKLIPDGIKRWVNEAQEAVNSDNVMVQHHALGLLYHIRKSDRLAVSKLVTKYIRSGLKSPYAVCMLIRIASKLIEDEDSGTDSPYFDFIDSCLRHKLEMVVYEAANAIVNLKCTSQRELTPAVSVLQLFLSSPKPTLRFAAVRTLNKVAMTHPNAVTACNVDLENLITDANRSIATLAITTLLKTGSESSVERLMKQISSFMSEISDEFKIVVVGATRQLCQKFPRKHNVMMVFLSNMLREEGGYEYKKSIVDTIINIIDDNPEAKEAGLAYLCEFIEDCEHVGLAVRILHLLGKEGPRTSRPSKYIRFIYNRLILENAPIRAAAVSSLAKFGAHCEDLLHNILVLLERSCLDTDDEVRDRATYYLNVLKLRQKSLHNQCILNPLQVSLVGLEKALQQYILEPSVTPFDMKSVPLATQVDKVEERPKKPMVNGLTNEALPNQVSKAPAEKIAATRQDIYAEQLAAIPEFVALKLGPILKSSLPIELTESETEYVVQCVKHIFKRHIVLQFDCTNTLNDQILENVRVSMQVPDGFEEVCTIVCPRLNYNIPAPTYTCLEIVNDDTSMITGTCENILLKYIVKDCDPNTGQLLDEDGYDDEYALEDVDILVADYMQRILKPNFGTAWEEIDSEHEVEETYALSSFKAIDEAIKNVIGFMGMQPCERSEKVPEGKSSHTLYLAGVFRGTDEVLVRAKLAVNTSNFESGVTMKMSVRCRNPEVATFIALKRDYKEITNNPIPNIYAKPLDNNILEWHFAMRGAQQTPYENGLYHGRIEFPVDFPFKPPSFYMLTPNGRFKCNTKICLNTSNYHPEAWNPSWSVASLLIGLYSFMNDDEPTWGSLRSSKEERMQLALMSWAYNLQDPIFVSLFPELAQECKRKISMICSSKMIKT